jgi:alkaline phosphatase
VRPARNGIIANEWQDPQLKRLARGNETFSVYCVEQPGRVGSESRPSVISPQFLRVPTLGDRMKAAHPDTRVIAVSGKDRAAVMLAGRQADLTLWWTSDGFTTYTDQIATIPPRISGKVNPAVRESYRGTMKPTLPSACASKARSVRLSPTVAVGTLQTAQQNSGRWRATPALDAFTVEAALVAVDQYQLGQRAAVDLLAVSLSATDYVGHYFGTEGAEMCIQQLALDATIGRLLDELDQRKLSYVVALTADHGGIDVTERLQQQGVPAQRIDADLLPVNASAALAKQLGLAEPVLLGTNEFASDVYFGPEIPTDRRAALMDAALRKFRAHPQVEVVFTKNELIAAAAPSGPVDEWTLLERAKASFDPQRSGDLVVLLKQYVSIYPIPKDERDYVTTHGSAWGYDRRVPILFWWRGMAGFEQPMAVETVDIAPTLASLIRLDVPASEFDGRSLTLLSRD